MPVEFNPRRPHFLAVSPHLDDAVMSVGGALAARCASGFDVTVCTAFAGEPIGALTPAARAFHRHSGLTDEDAVRTRRREDERAVGRIGARTRHLGFPDAIYRWVGDRPLCDRPGAMCDPRSPAEPELREALAARLSELILELRPDEIWTCSALGGHIDHRHVRAAVQQACRVIGRPYQLWRDLPYGSAGHPAESPGSEWTSPHGLAPEHLRLKLSAIGEYSSQIKAMWPDQDWLQSFPVSPLSDAELITTVGV